MLDIDSTFIIQLVNFLVVLVALHYILFKPIRQIIKERGEKISSALGDAKTAQDRMQSLLEQYNSLLDGSKQKATAAYNAQYQQGLDIQRELIAAERAKAAELLDKVRTEIASMSSSARADLKKEAEKLSQDITSKLLGRAV